MKELSALTRQDSPLHYRCPRVPRFFVQLTIAVLRCPTRRPRISITGFVKRYGWLLVLGLMSLTVADATPSAKPSLCPAFPFFNPQEGPLATINCDFHHLYEKRLAAIQKSFGAKGGRPVILNLGGTLIFKYEGQTEKSSITPPAYHEIKAFSHVVFSIFLLLSHLPQGEMNEQDQTSLHQLKHQLHQAIKALQTTSIPPDTRPLVVNVATITDHFIENILSKKSFTPSVLKAYFDRCRPDLRRLIDSASFIELSSLHQILNRWLAKLKPQDLQRLGVVLAVSHQARAREISLQYFGKRLGFKYGEGALFERGFVVLEDKFDEKSALLLLARHYLDREVAKVILNDANGLQSDLLSDSTRTILANCFNGEACPLS